MSNFKPSTYPCTRRSKTDNFVFQLHYRWTVILLVFCSLVVTCRLVLGHSFSCHENEATKKVNLETKCYAEGIYSMPFHSAKTASGPSGSPKPEYRRHQTFYRWVNLFLLVQAALFYFPHLVWESYESGRLERLTRRLDSIIIDDRRAKALCHLAAYVINNQGTHRTFTGVFIICEVLNYVVSLSQTLWLVHFFEVTGVPESVNFNITTWSDFEKFYFPESGTCLDFPRSSVVHCFLPLNKLYMFIFLFVHAWFIFVTCLSGAVLVYRLVLLAPAQRAVILRMSCPGLDSLGKHISYSDFFFLTRFQKVMSDVDFGDMMDKMAAISTGDMVRPEEDFKYVDTLSKSSEAEESPV
ncbi:hypothetical protein JTE90_020426 [Oedothorax gibbosus]|uniref:Innexin n=1 Tax=Oedothorax gibbosus TaxID=931172 RepID=A0AAV6UEL0_9ARAC|nr:hypothetical protein JTE90_020426 [Oedothorax gibbosus]